MQVVGLISRRDVVVFDFTCDNYWCSPGWSNHVQSDFPRLPSMAYIPLEAPYTFAIAFLFSCVST